ncbi:transposase [Phaeobacter sp. HF9A]|uniref:transposase n=1 Tax=Phaeobacter sp. HF9A TaxID=2721561 RepID=UPI0014317EEB|nr:transposase [Phaeobacter sp. HF9A]
MGTSNYSDAFKRDAVHQIKVRRYPVREVSRRLGVRTHALYKWMKLFGAPVPNRGVDHEDENQRLKRELARVTEERDILRKATVYFARGSQWSTSLSPRIRASSAFGPCAGCCGSISRASMHGLRSREATLRRRMNGKPS